MVMATTEPAWTLGYEDAYEGAECSDGRDLLANLHGADSVFAHLNIPVWIDVPERAPDEACDWCAEYGACGEHRLSVGVMKPRHGLNIIYYTDSWTLDDVAAIRLLMLSVWAHRADTGFSR